MKMRFLGKSGIKVSEVCLGTMTFGSNSRMKQIGSVGQPEADKIVAMALDGGINFFDTADLYSEGAIGGNSGQGAGENGVKILSWRPKSATAWGLGQTISGSPVIIFWKAVRQALKRLGTDYIDLYLVHRWDPSRPLEETMRVLDDLVRQGKVRYVGCSNFAGWQLMKALAISDKHDWENFIAFQGLYSLMARDLEYELAPLCVDQGLGNPDLEPAGRRFVIREIPPRAGPPQRRTTQ
jgi:aryl-alcohol dehydrogenase-like predicted oxidoreductase